MINTGKIAYSAAAKNTYQGEVKSLMRNTNHVWMMFLISWITG